MSVATAKPQLDRKAIAPRRAPTAPWKEIRDMSLRMTRFLDALGSIAIVCLAISTAVATAGLGG